MAVKYKWLASILREQIHKNIKNGTTKLPTENELCQKYHVSRQTVRQALSLLQQEKLVEKRHGSGTYITGILEDPRHNAIGILIPDAREYIYPGLLADIHNTLSASGFTEKIFETHNQAAQEREILTSVLKSPLRGIIAEGCRSALPNPNLDLYRKLRKKGTHVLFIRSYYPALKDSLTLTHSCYNGTAALVRRLISLGRKAIGCIFQSDDIQGIQCYQGYIETLRDCGLPLLHKPVCWYDTEDLHALETEQKTDFLKRMIKERLTDCSAVICSNDEIAYWLTRELLLCGCDLPEDMVIAAFDHMHLNYQGIQPAVLMAHKPHELGINAAAMMISKLRGLPVHSLEIPWFPA